MTGFNKVFLDTVIFIYLLENNEYFGERVASFIEYCTTNGISLTTSVITHKEFCIKPYKLGKNELITAFEKLCTDLDINLQDITLPVADTAARLRSKYQGLRGMDALQISAAIHSECDKFMTNDRRLKPVNEIGVMLIKDWSHS
jgi:predicted nucleic acid-binding protein